MSAIVKITGDGVFQEQSESPSGVYFQVPSFLSTGEEIGESISNLSLTLTETSSSLSVVSSSVDVLRVEVDALIAGGGGGGITIIPDAGFLSGTYSGNVLCEGTVTVTGNVTVKGDLTVVGLFTNAGGHQLEVFGDLRTFSVSEFTNVNPAGPSAQINVRGSWHLGQTLQFEQTGGIAGAVYVGGDLIGSAGGGPTASIMGYGQADTSGLLLIVQGDLYAYTIEVDGGPSSAGPAGSGGNILVYGNLHTARDVHSRGGEAFGTGFSAGSGGNITVYGNLICSDDLRFQGGDGQGASANGGNGGTLEVYGDLIVEDQFNGYGGSSNAAAGGNGGSITVFGDFIGQNPGLQGGNGATSGGVGGYLDCAGNVDIDFINVNGGNGADTTFGQGAGGWISIRGNLVCTGNITLNAGESTGAAASCSTSAPNGTCLFVEGDAHVFYVSISGGVSTGTGAGGQSGNAEIGGNLNVKSDFVMFGGDATSLGNGGNGGSLVVRGSILGEGSLNLKGGDCGDGGSGGNSGDVIVTGDLKVALVALQGGGCYGSTGGFSAGAGGSLLVKGFTSSNQVLSRGGSVSNVGDTKGAPGATVVFEGGIACNTINFLDGPGITGISPTSTCAIKLSGNCTFGNIDATDRAGIKIAPGESGLPPAVVKVNVFTAKDTFNDGSSGVASGNLALLAADSLFLSNVAGSWSSITGTSIFGP